MWGNLHATEDEREWNERGQRGMDPGLDNICQGSQSCSSVSKCEQGADGQLGHQPEQDIVLNIPCKEGVPTLLCLILAH